MYTHTHTHAHTHTNTHTHTHTCYMYTLGYSGCDVARANKARADMNALMYTYVCI